jgi:lactoylglutathione lyase
MNLERTGIILKTENFDACVNFYRGNFSLPLMFEKHEADFRLACLEFGGAYLMIETGGPRAELSRSLEQNPVIIRFNAGALPDAEARLEKLGTEYSKELFDWGTVLILIDPDGNRVEVRDEQSFIP